MLFLLLHSPSYMPGFFIVPSTPTCLIFYVGHAVSTCLYFSAQPLCLMCRALGCLWLEHNRMKVVKAKFSPTVSLRTGLLTSQPRNFKNLFKYYYLNLRNLFLGLLTFFCVFLPYLSFLPQATLSSHHTVANASLLSLLFPVCSLPIHPRGGCHQLWTSLGIAPPSQSRL